MFEYFFIESSCNDGHWMATELIQNQKDAMWFRAWRLCPGLDCSKNESFSYSPDTESSHCEERTNVQPILRSIIMSRPHSFLKSKLTPITV